MIRIDLESKAYQLEEMFIKMFECRRVSVARQNRAQGSRMCRMRSHGIAQMDSRVRRVI